VLLADDHLLVAEALKSLLTPEFDLVGVVEDGRALVKAAARLRPDVIVADVTMPHLNGIDALIQLRRGGDGVPVVFLTMHRDVSFARRALEAGASGFVLKHSASVELIAALRAALDGKTYLTPQLAGEVLAAMKQGPERAADPLDSLTPRQREVLQLVAEGRSAKEIASSLSISTRTVEFHKYQMMETLGLHINAELIHFAIKHGVVELQSLAREPRSLSAASPVISRGHNLPKPDYTRLDARKYRQTAVHGHAADELRSRTRKG
jgi:DNA-binding NarL/FixJ family response regulator